MLKRLCGILLIITMIFVSAGCNSSDKPEGTESEEKQAEETAEEPENLQVGGWEFTDNKAAVLPKKVHKAFDKATEEFAGSDLTPVAFVGKQVVAGNNYMLLCREMPATAEPLPSYQMVVIYADLEGNAEITSMKNFDLAAYTGGDNTEISSEELSGGWAVPKKMSRAEIPADAKKAFRKAAAGFDGSSIRPMALLGTQIVAGTNYAFICKSTLTTQKPISGIQIVTVYEDLEGKAEITNISTVDPADFNE